MRCNVDRYHFFKAIEFTSQFSPAKSHNDLLTFTKLAVSRDRMVVSAFDGEAQAEVDVDCNSSVEFHAMVNTQMLLKVLKNCDMDWLILEVDDPVNPVTLSILNHEDKFDLVVSNGDLPSLPSVEQHHITLPGGFLARANSLTVATDVESNRYALGGILFDFSDDGIHLAATDGRRMMYYHTPIQAGFSGQYIVPVNVIKRLAKFGDADMKVNQNMVIFESPKYRVASRLMDGRYPNYIKVVEPPKESPESRRTIDREVLLSSLKRVMLVQSEETRGATWKGNGRKLTLESETAGVGKGRVTLECEGDAWDSFSVTLDSKLVMQMIERLAGTTVLAEFYGDSNAVHIRCDGVLCVAMPMFR